MANKPLRPCRHPGCTALVSDGYCDLHRPKDRRSAAAKSWHWMYLTPEWTEDLWPGQLLREPFCRECARHGARTPATEVDHIQPHRGDWTVFTDRSNLQSLCHSCHSRKTMAEMRQKPAERLGARAGRARGRGASLHSSPRSKKFGRSAVRPHAPLHERFFPHGRFWAED